MPNTDREMLKSFVDAAEDLLAHAGSTDDAFGVLTDEEKPLIENLRRESEAAKHHIASTPDTGSDGAAERFPKVEGRCPACGSDGTLFLANGGYVTCGWIECPDPLATIPTPTPSPPTPDSAEPMPLYLLDEGEDGIGHYFCISKTIGNRELATALAEGFHSQVNSFGPGEYHFEVEKEVGYQRRAGDSFEACAATDPGAHAYWTVNVVEHPTPDTGGVEGPYRYVEDCIVGPTIGGMHPGMWSMEAIAQQLNAAHKAGASGSGTERGVDRD